MKFLGILFAGLLLSFASLVSEVTYAADPEIKVPAFKNIQDLKRIYKTDGTPQILLVMHLPKGPGKGFLEVYNHTGRNISIFQFSLHSVGQTGDLVFEDLPSGWSGVKDTRLSNINELTIIQPRVIDDKAVEFYPKLVIHYEIGKLSNFKSGTKKKFR